MELSWNPKSDPNSQWKQWELRKTSERGPFSRWRSTLKISKTGHFQDRNQLCSVHPQWSVIEKYASHFRCCVYLCRGIRIIFNQLRTKSVQTIWKDKHAYSTIHKHKIHRPPDGLFPSIASFFSVQPKHRKGPSQARNFPRLDEPAYMETPSRGWISIWHIAHTNSLNMLQTGYLESNLHFRSWSQEHIYYNLAPVLEK